MRKYILPLFLLVFFPVFSQDEFEAITLEDLINHDFFMGSEGPGLSYFSLLKLKTVFNWPGNIKEIDSKIIDQINNLQLPKEVIKYFSHYVEIEAEGNVRWKKEKVKRIIRIYLQEQLMNFIYEELEVNDKFEML
jgi:transcriptional regulator with PAS, ATPase and Fis domain